MRRSCKETLGSLLRIVYNGLKNGEDHVEAEVP